MVASPTVTGEIRLITYGTLEMGDVPRFAFIENATPNDITNRPAPRNRYLLRYSVFMALLQMLIPVVFSKKLSDVGNALSATQGTLMKTLKENLSSFFTIITFRIEKETGRIM